MMLEEAIKLARINGDFYDKDEEGCILLDYICPKDVILPLMIIIKARAIMLGTFDSNWYYCVLFRDGVEKEYFFKTEHSYYRYVGTIRGDVDIEDFGKVLKDLVIEKCHKYLEIAGYVIVFDKSLNNYYGEWEVKKDLRFSFPAGFTVDENENTNIIP